MHLHLDEEMCAGHGLCYFESDELFDLRDSDGKAVILLDPVPDRLIGAARQSVELCPERALRLVDSNADSA